ncbi:MAG TPA: M23 family metallopeptidase [Pseudoflavonifractor sp.]|nr:M23 family metallopeptidase [Pseudoflavonifractor sp.]
MDEILHSHDEYKGPSLLVLEAGEQTAPSPRQSRLRRSAAAAWDALEVARRRAAGVLHRVDAAPGALRFLAPVAFLAASAAIGAALVLTTVYTPSYQVTVDGMALGAVKEPAVYEEAVSRVEARASRILGYDYTVEHDVTYEFAFTEKDALTPEPSIESYLFDHVGEVMKTYVLRVNGAFIGAAVDESSLTAMLDAIKAPYMNENTASSAFVEDVSIVREYTPSDIEQNLTKMVETLTANTNGETQYEVKKGDTFMQIAYDNGMDMSELEALNPEQDVNKLYIGQILTVRETIPFLSVKTVERQVYTEAIACPVEEVEDNTLYQGETKVITPGVEGQAQITADVTYVNGSEKGRDVMDTLVLAEPTTKVVAVGTKERPTWLPTGHFIWPTYGSISSRFGYRYIFGSYSYHSGIDIAVPYGSSIKAADGGTVIWSGTGSGSNWSYGKYIIIDHGNGKQTYYAHNSSLLVSVGDKVYQGQVIAKAGSTGRSTGSHCHFQVKINGSDVNPLSYLP